MSRESSVQKSSTILTCKHEAVEPLGLNAGVEFLRCPACGAVIVTDGNVRLAIPPVRAAG